MGLAETTLKLKRASGMSFARNCIALTLIDAERSLAVRKIAEASEFDADADAVVRV